MEKRKIKTIESTQRESFLCRLSLPPTLHKNRIEIKSPTCFVIILYIKIINGFSLPTQESRSFAAVMLNHFLHRRHDIDADNHIAHCLCDSPHCSLRLFCLNLSMTAEKVLFGLVTFHSVPCYSTE